MGILKNIVKTVFKDEINNHKGKVGEAKVNRKLNPLLFGKIEHKQINNLILMDENGKTHQIDHVEIRENGIFCIETKNYIGWIFGDENQEQWTQTLYTGEKNKFVNPLKQNKSHIYHMSQVLEKKYKINSVVVMVQNNADKIKVDNVVNLDKLSDYLRKYDDGTHYSSDEMEYIYNKLMSSHVDISNREHVKNIRTTQKELKEGICPRCGGQLVEKTGQYEKFYGCSNYPKCKFIKKNN